MKQIPVGVSFAFVDDEDFPLLNRVTWCLTDHGYAKNRDALYMHSLVLGLPSKANFEIDHIDRVRLNNQKANLRLVTKQRNLMNRPAQVNNATGFKGVFKRTNLKSKPFQASIGKRGSEGPRTHHIGYFATAEEAARAYDKMAKELFGE